LDFDAVVPLFWLENLEFQRARASDAIGFSMNQKSILQPQEPATLQGWTSEIEATWR
jgi:hypothetical protein